MKYLIIKCEELCDAYECDCNRTPICITDDYAKYNDFGYEVYEIKDDGFIGECIKNYEDSAMPIELIVFEYNEKEEDLENNSDINIIDRIPIKTDKREEIIKTAVFEEFIKKYLDTELKTVEEYKNDFSREGTCDDMEFYESGTVISIKQGKRIWRNY